MGDHKRFSLCFDWVFFFLYPPPQPSNPPCTPSHHQQLTPAAYIKSHKTEVTLEDLLLSNQDSNRQEMKGKGPPEKCSKTLPSSDSSTERRARPHPPSEKQLSLSLLLCPFLSFFICVHVLLVLEIGLGLGSPDQDQDQSTHLLPVMFYFYQAIF